MAIVTLTSDFGEADGYVGALKGVLHRLAPGTTVVDLAHGIPRHDVAHAAWVLASAAFEFPAGTIHVAVVDPGVGGRRAEVVVAARGHLFVGPDNGLFAYVGAEAPVEAWSITAPELYRPDASATFRGRDVFAPTAAALARGLAPSAVGPAVKLVGRLPWTRPAAAARVDRAVEPGEGAVAHIDVYGNLVTNVRWTAGVAAVVRIAGQTLPLSRTYEDVGRDELVAYVGSAGSIEIAVREGDAARTLAASRGERVVVEPVGEGG